MSESAPNPNMDVLSDEDVDKLLSGSPPSASGADTTGAGPSSTPGTAAEPDASNQPEQLSAFAEFLAGIPEEEQERVANEWLLSKSPEKRAQLPAVGELLGQVAQDAARRQQQADQSYKSYQDFVATENASRQAFLDDQTEDKLNGYVSSIEHRSQRGAIDAISQVFQNHFARHGVNDYREFSDDAQALLRNAKTETERWSALVRIAEGVGYQYAEQTIAAKGQSPADKAVMRESIKKEALAELAREGRIRLGKVGDEFWTELIKDDLPPPMSGIASIPGAGPARIDENSSLEDLFAAAQGNLERMKTGAGRR